MPLPTLLQKGKIVIQPHHDSHDKEKIRTTPAIEYIMSWFKKRIPASKGGIPLKKATSVADRIMILQSGTGSGKSTTLGPELYLRFGRSLARNIAVTQPRVLTAMSIPRKIAKIFAPRGITLKGRDANIGWQTKNFRAKPRKGIIFMTVGVLAQQFTVMSDDEISRKYGVIIIDECHMREVQMDTVLALLKKFMHRNYAKPTCPFLICTSATFDTKKYADYFDVSRKKIIQVAGKNYPIKEIWPQHNLTDYISYAVETAIKIHTQNKSDYLPGRLTDILIFVHGSPDERNIIKALENANEEMKGNNHFVPIKLNRRTFYAASIDYRNVYAPLGDIDVVLKSGKVIVPKRRIMVATNIAETGMTIETLKYLIDTGYQKTNEFNPVHGVGMLLTKHETQANAIQRKGRVGREAPGEWYPMFTKEIFDNMNKNEYPEILTNDITGLILKLIMRTSFPTWDGTVYDVIEPDGVFDPKDIDMLDYPSIDSLSYSLEKLYVLGYIDRNIVPTRMALLVSNIMDMRVESFRMIMAGFQYGANISDLITIASFLSMSKRDYINSRSKNNFSLDHVFKKDSKESYYYDKFFIADDFIMTLFIWESFMCEVEIMKDKLSIQHIIKWCDDNGLMYSGLLAVSKYRDALIQDFFESLGVNPFYNEAGLNHQEYSITKIFQEDIKLGIEEVKKIKNCIYEGFRLTLCQWNDEREKYLLVQSQTPISLKSNITRPLPVHEDFKQIRPRFVVTSETVLNQNRKTQLYMFEGERVSSMDGYVLVDNTFGM